MSLRGTCVCLGPRVALYCGTGMASGGGSASLAPEHCDLSFRNVEVLGYFSLDSERGFHADLSQLKYLKAPNGDAPVHYDLNHRLNDVIKRGDQDEKLDNLLKWILNDKRVWKSRGTTQVAEGERTPMHFVSYRGLLSKLLSTPYENFDGWIICASIWKGTIYLCAKETEEHKQKRAHETLEQKKFMMWGRKFEQYVLADTVDGTPDANRPVNENEELCVVYGSRVNTHSLLYGAEMDGVDSREELRSYQDLRRGRFVELKTHRIIQKRAHENSFKKYKLRSVWCQVAPVAIDCVLFGHRSDDGIVKVLNRFNIDEILDESAEWQAWESDKCLDFMNKFLEEVKKSAKQHLPENSPDSVIKFEWQLGQARVRADVIVGPSEYSFLPKWFTDNFQHSVQVVKHT